jgi:hypothetical protein
MLCHNLSLGTKARAYKGAGQEWNLRVTFHAPGSVGECEGMNFQMNSHFGSQSINGLFNLQRAITRSKFIVFKNSLYH